MVVTYGAHDSRCLYEVNAPQSIHWATVDGDPACVAQELIGVVRAVVPTQHQIDAKADVMAVIERFESCRAIDPDDVVPVARDARLWEMRIELLAYALLIRVYETEIDELPAHIVALRAHRKHVDLTDEEIRAAQDAEIDIASSRYDGGRSVFWGLT